MGSRTECRGRAWTDFPTSARAANARTPVRAITARCPESDPALALRERTAFGQRRGAHLALVRYEAAVHALHFAGGRSHCIGGTGTALTERCLGSLGGVATRLALHLGVDLSAEHQKEAREIEPHQQHDHPAHGAVGLGVAAKSLHIQ